MSNRLIIWLLLALLAWIHPAQAWAASIYSPAPAAAEAVISLERNPELDHFLPGLQAAPTGLGGIQIEPWFWLLSVPVGGLGQTLMGDPVRGMFFFLAPIAIAWSCLYAWLSSADIQSGINLYAQSPASASQGGFTTLQRGGGGGTLVLLVAALVPMLAVWIWNIGDAYLMNQQLTAPDFETTPESQAQAERRRTLLVALQRFSADNQLSASDAGLALHHRLMSF